MPSESFPDSSPEQVFARKLAAQELAKYCEEFSRWRKTRAGSAALDKGLAQTTLEPFPLQKRDAPLPHSSP